MSSFASMTKTELRAACKAAGILYSKLTVGGMRDTLTAHHAAALSGEKDQPGAAEFYEGAPDVEETPVTDKQISLEPEAPLPQNEPAVPELDAALQIPVKDSRTTPEDFGISATPGPTEAPINKTNGAEQPAQSEAAKAAASKAGLKIEKNREVKNGVKRPSLGGACRQVWDALDAIKAAGEEPTSKQVKELSVAKNWNANNASIEFYNWRKFNGIASARAKK